VDDDDEVDGRGEQGHGFHPPSSTLPMRSLASAPLGPASELPPPFTRPSVTPPAETPVVATTLDAAGQRTDLMDLEAPMAPVTERTSAVSHPYFPTENGSVGCEGLPAQLETLAAGEARGEASSDSNEAPDLFGGVEDVGAFEAQMEQVPSLSWTRTPHAPPAMAVVPQTEEPFGMMIADAPTSDRWAQLRLSPPLPPSTALVLDFLPSSVTEVTDATDATMTCARTNVVRRDDAAHESMSLVAPTMPPPLMLPPPLRPTPLTLPPPPMPPHDVHERLLCRLAAEPAE
jgi:hypothetical protein